MKKTTQTLILIVSLALSVSSLSAKSFRVEQTTLKESAGLAINIIQQNQEQISGHLINADGEYFVFDNPSDESVQVIPRSEVSLLETNLDIDLFALLKSHDSKLLTDTIELMDGAQISCIILDVSSTRIQYFTGKSLRRQVLSTDSIYSLHLNNNSVAIPFPMIVSAAQAL